MAVGVLVVGLIAVVAWVSANVVPVTVINDRPGVTRLSGCVDDSLDLNAGQTGEVDIVASGRIGCMVSIFGVYEGCLILHTADAKGDPVAIFARVDKAMGDNDCTAVN